MIHFRIYKGEKETGALLEQLVHERTEGMDLPEVCVCWGCPNVSDLPALNARAGANDKLEQFRLMREKGVKHMPFYVPVAAHGGGIFPPHFPVLARNLRHTGGTDILVCKDQTDVKEALMQGRAFFTLYIAAKQEYRFWIFRNKCIGAYVKVRTKPPTVAGIPEFVANYKNGYCFYRASSRPESGISEAIRAVASVGLDFGAVDILEDQNRVFWVLEVNSAPGVQAVQKGISNLADEIIKWAKGQSG